MDVLYHFLAQLAGNVEYTNCISAEGKALTLELWGMQNTSSLLLLPGSL